MRLGRSAVGPWVVCVAVSCVSSADAGRVQREPEPAEVTCPAPLGEGVTTGATFCDVLTGRDAPEGILVQIPRHQGRATLRFELHNRQTYSEQEVLAGRAFARSTATIGVLTMDNELLTRAVIQSEFRTATDLMDRVGGGAGPEGLKAVAPIGTEAIEVTIPANVNEVSILGERLEVMRVDREETFTAPGRPIATISHVTVEYRPR